MLLKWSIASLRSSGSWGGCGCGCGLFVVTGTSMVGVGGCGYVGGGGSPSLSVWCCIVVFGFLLNTIVFHLFYFYQFLL